MAENKTIFRKKTMERIASPEQLTDYLRVTNPGIWILLAAVILFFGGLIIWSSVGTLETRTEAKAVVASGDAMVIAGGAEDGGIKAGMPVRAAELETVISSVDVDEYGREIAHAHLDLPDGVYDAEIITERIHPIAFLLESR